MPGQAASACRKAAWMRARALALSAFEAHTTTGVVFRRAVQAKPSAYSTQAVDGDDLSRGNSPSRFQLLDQRKGFASAILMIEFGRR